MCAASRRKEPALSCTPVPRSSPDLRRLARLRARPKIGAGRIIRPEQRLIKAWGQCLIYQMSPAHPSGPRPGRKKEGAREPDSTGFECTHALRKAWVRALRALHVP